MRTSNTEHRTPNTEAEAPRSSTSVFDVRIRRPGVSFRKAFRRLAGDSGALSVEYMLILVMVVLPIAMLMKPVFLQMIDTYGARLTSLMRSPFP